MPNIKTPPRSALAHARRSKQAVKVKPEPIVLQATGEYPLVLDDAQLISAHEAVGSDGRGVRLMIYSTRRGALWTRLDYVTANEDERQVTWLHEQVPSHMRSVATRGWPYEPSGALRPHELIGEWLRGVAQELPPPGAGHPVGEGFEHAQAKLAGRLETFALVCWTRALADLSKLEATS
jgi:hypothetical protein